MSDQFFQAVLSPSPPSLCRQNHDILGESSPVPATVLRPAERLEWNISGDSAWDIEKAKMNVDRSGSDYSLIRFIV